MDVSELFWSASLDEWKQGFIQNQEHYICLLCGDKTEKGVIYPVDDMFYDAEKAMKIHIEKEHGSVFDYLIGLDKKLTGLTDHQNRLLRLFYAGKNDAEIQKELEIGSSATIRNHRFVLKEKERQAKMMLTIMELLREKDQHAPVLITPHKAAKMIDSRYNVTQEEEAEMLEKLFPEGTHRKLKKFPLKEKQKLIVLKAIADRFEGKRKYDEKEVNQLLESIYHDYVLLRRYLIEYGFLARKADGSEYWKIL
ncbi:DUF2087 domain-containing protein [Bacillus sp. CMF21]|uniref:DUF2087 domain-containing protein n=1 Tax=Metabacillus dongyingensis TaxID=2874282 RepID=UPI001CBD29F4|nr:DUF2087 domain-containing protein [Metabacillus dongyingensis]UAL52500.1 DUF2087 domain-containing protein [Metabacillus dongyingensis]USK28809.1 DUF2087 domain-containing protein [Bacillus sp. CMF21]